MCLKKADTMQYMHLVWKLCKFPDKKNVKMTRKGAKTRDKNGISCSVYESASQWFNDFKLNQNEIHWYTAPNCIRFFKKKEREKKNPIRLPNGNMNAMLLDWLRLCELFYSCCFVGSFAIKGFEIAARITICKRQ